ncbi:ribosome maturation factor RimM [Paenibacillus pini]|uniref:Ribosome maturation factor RimM n=1 Tax=Paenibacillus pini JCM 16418 TaxID=1236976 RepID=W7YQ76_9BACL|nr:ribosome maturation factor RimM [Paenibacillus pini]GAF06726.1 16S rRNA processing protein RimM [Paenibacillus pini JCM 16418]
MADKLYKVGKIVNTHGIKGEIKVLSITDFPEVRFAAGGRLLIIPADGGSSIPITIESSRLHKNMYILKLKGYQNINEVEKYKGSMLKVEESELLELPENEYYIFEIVGCKVVTDEARELGVIKEVLSPGSNDVWVVQPESGKDILIPVIDEVVLDVDVKNKLVTIHLMEGLLD